jgi:hypothetical protein
MPETAQPKRTKNPSYFVLVEKIGTDPSEQRRWALLTPTPVKASSRKAAIVAAASKDETDGTYAGHDRRVRVVAQKLIDGPNEYWSTDLPPSRGQYRDIALLALKLFGLDEPESRWTRRSLRCACAPR